MENLEVVNRDGGRSLENLKSLDSVENQRSKTSLRLQYEAEARVLRRQMGSLEEIRLKLGLTRRKMCKLLLLDPSTWTRWQRDEEKVPPHIYRALQWYMISVDKYPVLHPLHTISTSQEIRKETEDHEHKARMQSEERSRQLLEQRLDRLNENMSHLGKQQRIGLAWKFLLLVNFALLLLMWIFRSF